MPLFDAGATAAALSAVQAQIPTPATAMPPGIGVTGDRGDSTKYALANHTHASSVQRQRVSIALSAGRGVWVFPVPYAAGVIPVIETTVETPDAAAYAYDAKILAGSVSNTQCTVVVNKVNSSVTLPSLATSLLGFLVNILSPATGAAVVHCWAALPTQ